MQTGSQSQGGADTHWLLRDLVSVRRLPPALGLGNKIISREQHCHHPHWKEKYIRYHSGRVS